MNILFITQLYPLTEYSKNSFALHYFVKEWNKNNHVQIIRPYLPYEKEKCPKSQHISIDTVNIDIVKPFWIPVLKIAIVNKEEVKALIKKKPDVIVCHLYNSYFAFSFLKNYFKVPFIIGIHRSDILLASNVFYRQRFKKVIRIADLLIYRSLAIKKNFEEYVSPSKENFIAWSGIPDFLIHKAKNLLKYKKEIGPTKKIISVCRLIKLKQIDKVIIALSELKKRGYKWEYSIIGDGPERKKLELLTANLKLQNQIKFFGQIDRNEVFKQMDANDFFVMPSYNETFGLVYLEAMANGCIVLGSKGWGIDGIVISGQNGFLTNPHNQIELKNHILSLMLLDNKKLNEILHNSLNTAINFSDSARASIYLGHLKKIKKNV